MTRRAERLFQIIQVLRRANAPLTADRIAAELETSKRTIYRDIAALIAQRVPIRGEAGMGYVLEPGFHCPPLMLTSDELEAVALGMQWVIAHADSGLAHAARDVQAKIAAIIPPRLQPLLEQPVVGTPPPSPAMASGQVDVGQLRVWGRRELKLALRYRDEAGRSSERIVWPFMIGYVARSQALLAWCETREDFRCFLIERILDVTYLPQRYPTPRRQLRRRWLAIHAASQEEKGPGLPHSPGP